MKRFRNIMAVYLMLILVFALAGPANAAYNVKKTWVRFSATAGETLATGDVVCIKDADGYAYEADANDSNLRPAVGIVGKGAASGYKVEIIVVGILNGWSSLSEGAWAYLSETAGAVTQSAPTYSQIVGKAVTTTDYFFNFSNYLDTSALTALGTLSGETPIILEGPTADDYETHVIITDPTQDNIIRTPNDSGTVMLSALAANESGETNAVWGVSNGIRGEGSKQDDYEWTLAPENPTTDNTYIPPDYSGAIPLVIAQGYTQTSSGETTAADVTGSSLTLADGWFSEGRTIHYTLGGTVTGANDTISVILYFEDAAVMTLTTADGAAGDWTAEFTIVSVSGTAQRIVGVLRAEAGAEVITDYATDTTDISAAGTIPIKCQVNLASTSDVITNEYVRVDAWSKSD